ncbi:hypothetical protein BC833DRAFT_611439 [Globomyces pollinis-pini]|nr:hypothetical protein BC833DRAFT_611439 [Globomyces pollinis-pini]
MLFFYSLLYNTLCVLAVRDYLFLGASQVYGFQGNDLPTPFGKDIQNILQNEIQSTVNGLVGDCFGGGGCAGRGFYNRLVDQMNSNPTTVYESVFILGGSNDINGKTNGYPTQFNNYTNAMESMTRFILNRNPSTRIIFLFPFRAPLYTSMGIAKTNYDSLYNTFQTFGKELVARYPQVQYYDATPFIIGFKPDETYFRDNLHLNPFGNRQLALGLVQLLPLPFAVTFPTSTDTGVIVTSTFQPMPTNSPITVRVTFIVENIGTDVGQTVVITGSLPNLGEWNPVKGLKLVPSNCNGRFCSWIASTNVLANSNFSWKVVVATASNVKWECGNNHESSVSISNIFLKPLNVRIC